MFFFISDIYHIQFIEIMISIGFNWKWIPSYYNLINLIALFRIYLSIYFEIVTKLQIFHLSLFLMHSLIFIY